MIEDLQIERVLDLSQEDDQRELLNAVSSLPELRPLAQNHLDAYLSLFPEHDWRKVYPGGLIVIHIGEKYSIGLDLKEVLLLTAALKDLQSYPGYDRLLCQFRNLPQVTATIFEVWAAKWCMNRTHSLSLEFSPSVCVGKTTKYPDFLWHTELGDLYCECKSGRLFETRLHKKIENAFDVLKQIYDGNGPWDPMFRLDVRLSSARINKIRNQFSIVASEANGADCRGAHEGWKLRLDDIYAKFNPRGSPFQQDSETIVMGRAEVGTTPRNIVEASHLSLVMPVGSLRHRLVKRFLKDARKQLPRDAKGAVFIELNAGKSVQQKLQALISQPAYDNTPWVSLWQRGAIRFAAWRTGQPLDDRLLAARE